MSAAEFFEGRQHAALWLLVFGRLKEKHPDAAETIKSEFDAMLEHRRKEGSAFKVEQYVKKALCLSQEVPAPPASSAPPPAVASTPAPESRPFPALDLRKSVTAAELRDRIAKQRLDPKSQEIAEVGKHLFDDFCKETDLIGAGYPMITDGVETRTYWVGTGRYHDNLLGDVDIGCVINGKPLGRDHSAAVRRADGDTYSHYRGGEEARYVRLVKLSEGDVIRFYVKEMKDGKGNLEALNKRYLYSSGKLVET
jgi:hypothetical protein